ncbi:MAG: hypothetical protein LBT06_14140 [Hungatella sp.]|jgi:hypothetical protein|nr:hypothetical protein [Hungatella sp.]
MAGAGLKQNNWKYDIISIESQADPCRKRINQMLDELRSGDAYMGMAYSPKKSKKTGSS